MKLLLINVVCGIKSTGRICTDIAEYMEKNGHIVKIAYGRENVPEKYQKYAVKIGTKTDVFLHGLKKLILDGDGFGSKNTTKRFINWVEKFDPDIVHLHNIFGYYINVPILFKYLKKSSKNLVWTLHDCMAFTGGCAFFDIADCKKWKFQCGHCPQRGKLPRRKMIDASRNMLSERIKLYGDMKRMIIVTPSNWLKSYVKDSFLRYCQTYVIHNGVDTNIFFDRGNSLREKLNIREKYIILGVASPWTERKGLQDFIILSALLPSNTYRIVLIGLSNEQIRTLPPNIIGVQKTYDVNELAEYYSMADVFVNPTYEDNYPTTNLEAIACGTPVITYNTGGSGESATIYGRFVRRGDTISLVRTIENVCKNKPLLAPDINLISSDRMLLQYKTLYEGMENIHVYK